MTVLLVRKNREYLCRPGEELQTDLGVLTVPDDPTPGDVIETHLGEAFRIRRLRGTDLFHHFERTGAPMLPRDIGLIIGHAGIQSGDRVLDAGTGTGVLAGYLGRIGARVVTYEREPEFAEVARENMTLAGVSDRVEVRTGDITSAIDELDDVDVVTLDLEAAAAVVPHIPGVLSANGALAVYSPFIESTRAVVEAARDTSLTGVTTYETIQREMEVEDRGTRPTTTGVGHTGYLTFGRNE